MSTLLLEDSLSSKTSGGRASPVCSPTTVTAHAGRGRDKSHPLSVALTPATATTAPVVTCFRCGGGDGRG
jgi:hypothetical protein